jgi:predicted regulator of Ras-like GTPase activity (Roadblock/LC7/MglB family)/predicted Zn-dependent protease
MSDEISRLSDQLARDPASLTFLALGEALRKRGQLDLALRVATRGLERHPHNPEAHDLLARIWVDRHEFGRAFDEWDMVISLSPTHVGAHKGMGYVCFKQGRLHDAERYLTVAATHDGDDPTIATALTMVRRMLAGTLGANGAHAATVSASEEARRLFADILGDGEQTALLLDGSGLVTAGAYLSPDGADVAQEVGATLCGVQEEAQRTTKHLELGHWSCVVFETEVATVAMAPGARDSLVLVAAARTIPLGLVRRTLERCVERARGWLETPA